jgi:hypothetical protein
VVAPVNDHGADEGVAGGAVEGGAVEGGAVEVAPTTGGFTVVRGVVVVVGAPVGTGSNDTNVVDVGGTAEDCDGDELPLAEHPTSVPAVNRHSIPLDNRPECMARPYPVDSGN